MQPDAEPSPEQTLDFLSLALSQQAIVNEDARQLIADGPVDQGRHDRGVHPPAHGAQNPLASHFQPQIRGGALDERAHTPATGATGDAE